MINRSRVQVDYLHHLDLVEAEEVCIPAQRKQDRPGRTGDYFARIAPSSQKAALLICLRYGDRGLPVITYDPLFAAGAISPAATNHYGEAREMGEIGDWEPRPSPRRGKVANSFAPLRLSRLFCFSLSLFLPLCTFRFSRISFRSHSSVSPS